MAPEERISTAPLLTVLAEVMPPEETITVPESSVAVAIPPETTTNEPPASTTMPLAPLLSRVVFPGATVAAANGPEMPEVDAVLRIDRSLKSRDRYLIARPRRNTKISSLLCQNFDYRTMNYAPPIIVSKSCPA